MPDSLSKKVTEALCPPSTTQQKHLETMLQICRAIGTIQDANDLIQRILDQTTSAFDADRSSLFLHDPDRHELWARIAQGLDDDARLELRIPDDHGLAGQVFQTHQSLLLADAHQHPAFARQVAEGTAYVPRSMMVVAISHRPSRCDGVLQVMDTRGDLFTEDDLALLEAIAVQVAISLENARLYEGQRRQFLSFVKAFSAALDARDPGTQEHSINVSNYAQAIGENLGLLAADLEWLRIAGLLHDVGKIGTPEAILRKPGKLDDAEFVEMKKHALNSRHILSQIEFVDEYRDIDFLASAHHEKLDGSGYPDGLRGEQLPMKARILAVADIYHALTQNRYYRKGMSHEKAMAIIESMTPHQLDSDCVDALKRFLRGMPPPDMPVMPRRGTNEITLS